MLETTALDDYDSIARIAIEETPRHNLGVLKSVVGGLEVALSDRIDFDPRADYWFVPERRFLVAFLVKHFPNWPEGEAEQHLAEYVVRLSSELDEIRATGEITATGYEEGIAKVLEPVRAWIDRTAPFDHWQALKVRRDHAPTSKQSLALFCESVAKDGFKPHEPGIGRRTRWFAALGAHSLAQLEARQRFFNAYRNALMSHNSYRRAGSQFFGPIVSNTSTGVFLDAMRRWRDGASLAEAPLIALDSKSDEARDRSDSNVVGELWGFLNLHRRPFYNNRAALYQRIHDDPERAIAIIGEKTTAWLASNAGAASRLAEAFDRQVSDPETRSNFKRFPVRRWKGDSGSDFDRKLHDELSRTAVETLQRKSRDEKAAILLHLAMDTIAYAASVKMDDSAEVTVKSEGGGLRDRDRVWIYAPGSNAQHWKEDQANECASINFVELGDLRNYESRDEIFEALQEQREGDAEPSVAARTCWRFGHEAKVGDAIIAKQGRSAVVGIGFVTGPYDHVADAEEFPHRIPVRWEWSGHHVVRDRRSLPMATLSESTRRKNLLRELEPLLPAHASDSDVDGDLSEGGSVYTRDDALADLFIESAAVDEMLELLRRKKNIILQGPPGVGKTFVAKRLAYLLLGARDDSRVRMVQFHQAYTYEQFVRGYRPDGRGGFELVNGPFYELAETAKSDLESAYVLIIDEINRGNLGKILGEGMMLLEADKRSEDWALQLSYSRTFENDDEEERFYLPPNLHVIGTMNTADRSLAVVDYALRRRFSFIDLQPGFEHRRFREHLADLPPAVLEGLLSRVRTVNAQIREDTNLGAGFQIGHSYFCRGDPDVEPPWATGAEGWLREIFRFEVLPLLREYWYDDGARLEEVERLLGEGSP